MITSSANYGFFGSTVAKSPLMIYADLLDFISENKIEECHCIKQLNRPWVIRGPKDQLSFKEQITGPNVPWRFFLEDMVVKHVKNTIALSPLGEKKPTVKILDFAAGHALQALILISTLTGMGYHVQYDCVDVAYDDSRPSFPGTKTAIESVSKIKAYVQTLSAKPILNYYTDIFDTPSFQSKDYHVFLCTDFDISRNLSDLEIYATVFNLILDQKVENQLAIFSATSLRPIEKRTFEEYGIPRNNLEETAYYKESNENTNLSAHVAIGGTLLSDHEFNWEKYIPYVKFMNGKYREFNSPGRQ